jgi:hypothetical protein
LADLLKPLVPFPALFLQLHIEIVPTHSARDYTSDNKLWNNLYAKL